MGSPGQEAATGKAFLRLGVDDARVSLVHRDWKELRTAVTGQVTATREGLCITVLSNVTRLADAAAFDGRRWGADVARRARVAAHRVRRWRCSLDPGVRRSALCPGYPYPRFRPRGRIPGVLGTGGVRPRHGSDKHILVTMLWSGAEEAAG